MRTYLLAIALSLTAFIGPSVAERPSAMKLFPEESVVFIRIANAHDFGERVQQTSAGRMFQDPQVRPFIEAFHGKVGELYANEAEGKLGISWEDMKKLPKGEVAFAVVARPGQRRPALLLMIDQGDEPSVADKLVDRALDLAQEKGGEFSTEKIGDVEVTIVRDKDRENRMFGVFERENTIVAATDSNVLRNVLWHWDHPDGESSETAATPESAAEASASIAEKAEDESTTAGEAEAEKEEAEFVPGRTIAQNERFATIVRNCRRPQDPPPQLVFFIDPIELIRNIGARRGGVQVVLGLFPALGIDGLMGIGGAITYATDEYDDLSQLHVLLENPRSGVMLLPAFLPGDTSPQAFVPLEMETYMSWNANVRTTYDRLIALVDQYRYQGSVDKFVKENISDKLGIDVPTQIIDNLKGRYTWMLGYEQPAHLQGHQHVVAAEVVDENAAKESLKTVVEKYPEFFEEKTFGNVTYYGMGPKELREMEVRPVDPFVAITDGYVFIGTSCQLFERCIAARDGTAERLIDSNDFARTSAVIGRETVGVTPVMFTISRFEETMRQWYGVLTSEKTREYLEENKGESEYVQAMLDVMAEHELPPFETLAPYLAPGGGVFYDTDSGYHAIAFTLRNEAPPAPVEPPK